MHITEDGRNGTFVIGDDQFPASLLDLPSILESYKTYDDNVLIKTADIGQVSGVCILYAVYSASHGYYFYIHDKIIM